MSTNLPRHIATQLRHIANLIESANIGEFATPVGLSVSLYPLHQVGNNDEEQKAVIDQVATALTSQPATWEGGGGKYAHYRTEIKDDQGWSLASTCYVRRPDPVAEAQAEIARLRAQLAAMQAGDVDERHETPAGEPLPTGVEGTALTGRGIPASLTADQRDAVATLDAALHLSGRATSELAATVAEIQADRETAGGTR